MRHQNPTYAAMIKNLDANVGRLLEHLERRGLTKRTLVVFTSDNGGYVGRDGRGEPPLPVTTNAPLRSGKGALYEGGIRVPLVVRWPGMGNASGVRPTPVWLTDLFPTLLGAAGVEVDESTLDGLDLKAFFVTSALATRPRQPFFWHYPHYYHTTTPVSAVRFGDWKLLEYYEDGRRELYNLATDPHEERDAAPAEPARVAELAKLLDERRSAMNVALPTPNPDFRPTPSKR
jgi:arylsulfatase A-like enzyme